MTSNRGVNLMKVVEHDEKRAAKKAAAKKPRVIKTRADYEEWQWGKGGFRPGSSEKRTPIDLSLEKLSDKVGAAETSLLLFYKVMMCETFRIELRMTAAREILDRVWGKPAQGVHFSGTIGLLTPEQIAAERERRWALVAPLTESLAAGDTQRASGDFSQPWPDQVLELVPVQLQDQDLELGDSK